MKIQLNIQGKLRYFWYSCLIGIFFSLYYLFQVVCWYLKSDFLDKVGHAQHYLKVEQRQPKAQFLVVSYLSFQVLCVFVCFLRVICTEGADGLRV